MSLNRNREINPFDQLFVLCASLILAGKRLNFGDPAPDYLDLRHKHAHFHNGVLGTKAELESLGGEPIGLHIEGLSPVAKFLYPQYDEELAGEKVAKVVEPVSIENAKLLKSKKDLAGYAKQFNIHLDIDRRISLAKMLESLEEEARSLGLLPEQLDTNKEVEAGDPLVEGDGAGDDKPDPAPESEEEILESGDEGEEVVA